MSQIATAPVQPVPPPGLMTADEFAQRHGGEYVELVKGQVKELPMPFPKHGKICFKAARYFGNFIEERDLGHVMTNDSFVVTRRNPDTVRGSDVCYWSYDRLPKGAVPDGLITIPPDLVLEVRSPSERWTEVFAKILEYLDAGVRVAILLDSPSATASVYRRDEIQQIFDNGDELILPDVLPGFAIPVRQFFLD